MSNNNAAAVEDGGEAVARESSFQDIGGAIWARIKGFLPDMSNLYWQPLDPSSDMALSDRVSLVFQSARPVGEFLDLSKLNLPPMQHVSTRVRHNMETYLYNYFLLGCIHLVLFSLVHFGAILVALCWGGLVWFLYVANEGVIDICGKLSIDKNAKLLIATVTGVLAIEFGNVSTLLISLIVFAVIVVGSHGLLRDDTRDAAEVDALLMLPSA